MQKEQSPSGAKNYDGVEFPNGLTSFADRVISYNPCNGVEAPYNNPNNALGSPDYNGVTTATYVSLGNSKNICDCGSLVLEFVDNALVDVPGNDLYIFEVGPSVEATEVFISTDGQKWIDLGKYEKALRGESTFMTRSGEEFHFVKLCDYPDGETSSSPYPGPDIDAVGAIGSISTLPQGSSQPQNQGADSAASASSENQEGWTFTVPAIAIGLIRHSKIF